MRKVTSLNYQTLVTTIVAGVLALGMLISITVLLATGVAVPSEFLPALLMLIGVAVGGASKATSP